MGFHSKKDVLYKHFSGYVWLHHEYSSNDLFLGNKAFRENQAFSNDYKSKTFHIVN